MAKREGAAGPDADAQRTKRRKDSTQPTKQEDVEMADAGASSDVENHEDANVEDVSRSPEEVSELGLNVWHIVKDATAKDGRQFSPVFMRLPSKRQYPDYYDVIKQPIALEEIRMKLDSHKYKSFEELRQDFELCFKNARRYNIRESQIWRDAKTLQKLAFKEIDKIVRPEGDEDGTDEEGEKKKKGKGSNINRLMKNRLQKLIAMTGPTGNSLSDVFMDLPSRKKWPLYYKIIKRPICFEDIFKRIKRKEYPTVQDFMADVDLIFTNAMTFNEDTAPVYQDALVLKQYFHQIMKDVSSQPTQGTSDHPTIGKITLKVPNLHNSTPNSAETPVAGPSHSTVPVESKSGHIHLRIPAQSTIAENTVVDVVGNNDGLGQKGKSPALTNATLPNSNSITVPQRTTQTPSKAVAQTATTSGLNALAQAAASKAAPTTPRTPVVTHTTSAQSIQPSQVQATYQSYTTSQYVNINQTPTTRKTQTPAPVPSRSTSIMSNVAGIGTTSAPQVEAPVPPATITTTSTTATPTTILPTVTTTIASAPPPGPQFRSVRLLTLPLGRHIALDHNEGVRSWVVRLGGQENKVVLSNVEFLREDEEEEEEGEEEDGVAAKGEEELRKIDEEEEEEEEEHAPEVVAPTPPKRKRGRGRPPKAKPVQPNGVDKDKENKAKTAVAAAQPTNKVLRRSVRAKKGGPQPTIEDILVKLNGIQLNSRPDTPSSLSDDVKTPLEWDIEVTSGSHVLEVAQKSRGTAWKVYIERRV